MKKLLILLSFFLFGKLSIADNCKVEFSFFVKTNHTKQLNTTITNGVIYVDVENENDSLVIQLNKSLNCSNTIGSFLIDETKTMVTPKGNEIKTSSNGGLYKIEIVGPGTSEWYKIFVRVTKPTSVKNTVSLSNIVIYPNPATNSFFVENASNVETLKIYDITGTLVLLIENTFNKDLLEIDITKLPVGQYFIAFHNDKIKVTKKIVKL